ncbi:lytic transglycosylase domain-containing protein [Edaphobacter modestus]|uniref:Transglycosylase-like protein with SLT domain n=1 Tax=Edaphobacter modestus TaxID=388466 RepID=A0A4Q7XXE8_9BACT|nr:lytic transglycosylase domain-containing protein [Edaphobacter modestus]RZU29037.1 transglycosylase-like protein with SLT domain [Edaphobacter modestus]
MTKKQLSILGLGIVLSRVMFAQDSDRVVPNAVNIPIVSESRPTSRPEHPAEIVYYADAYADHYGVPRQLVYAFITQESGWKPRAVSAKGAAGLMQLMPATAAHYGVTDPFNISENIGAGVHYLADLIATFKDWRLAVASYYCGSTYPQKRGLRYANPDVVAYVRAIQAHYSKELMLSSSHQNTQGVNP